jgi:hypothetical protein
MAVSLGWWRTMPIYVVSEKNPVKLKTCDKIYPLNYVREFLINGIS